MTAPSKRGKAKKVEAADEVIITPMPAEPHTAPTTPVPSTTVETVAELATLFEGVFNQLVEGLKSMGHSDPNTGAREILNSGYNVAQVSISAANATKPEAKPRLTGFNR